MWDLLGEMGEETTVVVAALNAKGKAPPRSKPSKIGASGPVTSRSWASTAGRLEARLVGSPEESTTALPRASTTKVSSRPASA